MSKSWPRKCARKFCRHTVYQPGNLQILTLSLNSRKAWIDNAQHREVCEI